MDGFNVQESIKAQRKLCEEESYPHFAPSDGVCRKCRKNIYAPVEKERTLYLDPEKAKQKYTSGIKTEEASTKLVTGCPHCFRSYCD